MRRCCHDGSVCCILPSLRLLDFHRRLFFVHRRFLSFSSRHGIANPAWPLLALATSRLAPKTSSIHPSSLSQRVELSNNRVGKLLSISLLLFRRASIEQSFCSVDGSRGRVKRQTQRSFGRQVPLLVVFAFASLFFFPSTASTPSMLSVLSMASRAISARQQPNRGIPQIPT